HGSDDANHSDEKCSLADAAHFGEAGFEADKKKKDKDGDAREKVDEGVDGEVVERVRAAENCGDAGAIGLGKNGSGCVGNGGGRSEREVGNAAEIIAFAKNDDARAAKIVADIAHEKADEQFAEHGGLLEPGHQTAAKGGA